MDTPADRILAVTPDSPTALARGRRLLRRHRRWLALTAAALLGMGGGGFVWAATHSLPAFDTLKDYQPLIATRVYGSDGSEVFEFYRERRTVATRLPSALAIPRAINRKGSACCNAGLPVAFASRASKSVAWRKRPNSARSANPTSPSRPVRCDTYRLNWPPSSALRSP